MHVDYKLRRARLRRFEKPKLCAQSISISGRNLIEIVFWIRRISMQILPSHSISNEMDDPLCHEPLVSVEFEVFGKVQGEYYDSLRHGDMTTRWRDVRIRYYINSISHLSLTIDIQTIRVSQVHRFIFNIFCRRPIIHDLYTDCEYRFFHVTQFRMFFSISLLLQYGDIVKSFIYIK